MANDWYWDLEEEKPLTFEDLKKIVGKYFKLIKSYIEPGSGIPTFTVLPLEGIQRPEEIMEWAKYELKRIFNELVKELDEHDYYPFLRRKGAFPLFNAPKTIAPPKSDELILRLLPKKKEEKKKRLLININLILLIATIGTVMGASIFMLMSDLYIKYFNTSVGYFYLLIFGYMAAILGIIGIHEVGHLMASRRHKIKTSYPYFIPFIPPLGTMGAVIIQKSPAKNKDELFDVGLAGPFFGFLITLFVSILGYFLTYAFTNAQIYEATGYTINQLAGSQFPDPMLFHILDRFMLSPPPYNAYITASGGSMVYLLHIIAFAGWIGCFVTGLNLFPIGQLDGGHVSRAIFGDKYYRYVGWIAFFAMIFINFIMALLVFILSRFSFEHPGPLNDVSPLSKSRKLISFCFFLMLFLTVPLGSFFF